MQLDVTELINDNSFYPEYASGSIAELGETAGYQTYNYACSFLDEDSELYKAIVDTRRTVECYFREFGAWTIEEIREWSNRDLVGVLVQDIAGTYRELERYCDNNYPDETIEDVLSMDESEDMEEMPSSLYVCDGKWYFYVGV